MLHPVTSFLTDRVEVSTAKEQLKFIKSELARTEETTRVLEGMLARLAEVYADYAVYAPKWWLFVALAFVSASTRTKRRLKSFKQNYQGRQPFTSD